MAARLILAVAALLTGGYQIADGAHVLLTGRYLGPPTPGPWRHAVRAVGLDPFAVGPVFVTLGACWLAATAWLLATHAPAAWWALLATAVLTLWYLPLGTALALVTITTLLLSRTHLTAT
jgi:hypothetical protein